MMKRDSLVAYGSPLDKRQSLSEPTGLPNRDLSNPAYTITNAAGSSGRQAGHWLGDNVADWAHYLISIAEILNSVPMVGSDGCGYAGVTNELLCARWATLGAFSPFYRNHEGSGEPPHEFYRYPITAEAARNTIATRYQVLSYFYTAFYDQNQSGVPCVQPMFFVYPEDPNANALQYQYFYGRAIMVAPVTVENSTTTEIYMPDDVFYDYYTYETFRGTGNMVT
ncbi:hypothetical protein LTR74_016746 [Friedmanniomyces endolithicus]|nr:hypothetical protein LTR74_016746 [Friedmanniomyces endolithicus]